MANLADHIERYLKQQIMNSGVLEIQRAALASHFGCAPSQINYVLSTRFTEERGYVVESRRGGGGYIRIIRLNLEVGDDLHDLVVDKIGSEVTQDEALGYIEQLEENSIIDRREAAIMRAAVKRDTLMVDLPLRDMIRANLLKKMILAILRF